VDLILTLALIEYERRDPDSAKARFTQLLDSQKHRSTAHYYLGRLALLEDNTAVARDHFTKVEPGSDYLPALAQLTELMVASGEKTQALALVRDKRRQALEKRLEHIEGLYLLESQLLSNQNQLTEALAPLEAGLNRFPESIKLLYTRAMLFTRLDDLPKAEADFKRVLNLEPDNAAALNALGYTLADRTDRLEEAYEYIREAYRLSPDDPAVIDSLGWVEYLRGNHEAALKNLRNAMELMPDHEIAAHLGEVLWATGSQKEARQVWRRGLELHPDSPIILNTMKRLRAAP
jgi:tetratricopeptide (TPR) repeat protein